MPIEIKKHVREFVHKYLDVTAEQEHAIVDYALDTWGALPVTVKYLHFVGKKGAGKTRALKIMEYICQNPIMACGTSSPFAVVTMLQYPSTLILDDVDIFPQQEPDEDGYVPENPFDKILMVGANRNQYMIVGGKKYKTFGYKVIATHKTFSNLSLAYRCITIQLKPREKIETPILDSDVERIGKLLKKYFESVQSHYEYVTC